MEQVGTEPPNTTRTRNYRKFKQTGKSSSVENKSGSRSKLKNLRKEWKTLSQIQTSFGENVTRGYSAQTRRGTAEDDNSVECSTHPGIVQFTAASVHSTAESGMKWMKCKVKRITSV